MCTIYIWCVHIYLVYKRKRRKTQRKEKLKRNKTRLIHMFVPMTMGTLCLHKKNYIAILEIDQSFNSGGKKDKLILV